MLPGIENKEEPKPITEEEPCDYCDKPSEYTRPDGHGSIICDACVYNGAGEDVL